MSLAQHVSSVEGVEQEPEVAGLSLTRQASVAHSISYDPIPSAGPRAKKVPTLAPYEVSAGKRIGERRWRWVVLNNWLTSWAAQVFVGVFSCVTASGIIFGFDALKSILIEEKVYREYCTPDELRENVRVCYMQDQR